MFSPREKNIEAWLRRRKTDPPNRFHACIYEVVKIAKTLLGDIGPARKKECQKLIRRKDTFGGWTRPAAEENKICPMAKSAEPTHASAAGIGAGNEAYSKMEFHGVRCLNISAG